MFVFRGVRTREGSPAASKDGSTTVRKTNALPAPIWDLHHIYSRVNPVEDD
jgi:hypothetical protein